MHRIPNFDPIIVAHRMCQSCSCSCLKAENNNQPYPTSISPTQLPSTPPYHPHILHPQLHPSFASLSFTSPSCTPFPSKISQVSFQRNHTTFANTNNSKIPSINRYDFLHKSAVHSIIIIIIIIIIVPSSSSSHHRHHHHHHHLHLHGRPTIPYPSLPSVRFLAFP